MTSIESKIKALAEKFDEGLKERLAKIQDEMKTTSLWEGMRDVGHNADPDLDEYEHDEVVNDTERLGYPEEDENDAEDCCDKDYSRDADKDDLRSHTGLEDEADVDFSAPPTVAEEGYEEVLDEDIKRDFEQAVKKNQIIEVEFEDGDSMEIDPESAQEILEKASISEMRKAGKSKHDFLKFLNKVYK